ncbi:MULTISPECIES: Asd/ArgC dimerization domain-containing protein [Streptomyces]|uniref:Asd/ArgC dimerization domain-containing protein n=1 Tax=Streptomyces changanensis TaxID=2964669 RepID=A0ABY5N7D9_9ACTN|nr:MULTISPECIES: Asd/ArgC dimerization domain-containing protein [Streptomyces]UUS32196.1 Asd/ArgC dimerization domain-containing protein [Streptomyces changanensis]
MRRAVGDDAGPFAAPLTLDVVPWSGTCEEDGWSSEELRLRAETRRILAPRPAVRRHLRPRPRRHRPLRRRARAVRTGGTVTRTHEILATSPGVVLQDDPETGDFPTPADVVGTDPTWAGRARRHPGDERALEFLVCGDNLRKGAALNTAQIAEGIAAEPVAGRAAPA